MGTLTSQSLKVRMGSQWSQIKSQQLNVIKNNYTQQQFLIHSIPNTELNNIKLYFIREFSCLPQTPKIICLEKQNTQLIVLVERSQMLLSQWLQQINCQLSVLMKMNDVLCGINALRNKFGEFIITQKMIQMSVNETVLVWFNQKLHSNIIQLPLIKKLNKNHEQWSENIMVSNIVEIFRKNMKFPNVLSSMASGVKTFQQLRCIVKRKIQQMQRLNMSDNKISNQIQLNKQRSYSNFNRLRASKKRNASIYLQKHKFQTQNNTLSITKRFCNISAKKRHKSFLLEQALKQQQNFVFQQFKTQSQKRKSFFNQNPFPNSTRNDASSSQRNQSSNVSSKQYVKENFIKKDNFRPWKSFHHISLVKNPTKEPSLFRRKQCGYKNLTIYQVNQKQQDKLYFQNQAPQQQGYGFFPPTFKSISPTHSYKPCDSFSSKKQFSLKSTTGTLKKTRQFKDQIFRQLLISQRQTIKQQSDETYKNSNNYSVQTIKEEQREQQKCSLTVSQDFNQLFSGRQSNGCGDEENQVRQIQFEKVLWGNQ